MGFHLLYAPPGALGEAQRLAARLRAEGESAQVRDGTLLTPACREAADAIHAHPEVDTWVRGIYAGTALAPWPNAADHDGATMGRTSGSGGPDARDGPIPKPAPRRRRAAAATVGRAAERPSHGPETQR